MQKSLHAFWIVSKVEFLKRKKRMNTFENGLVFKLFLLKDRLVENFRFA